MCLLSTKPLKTMLHEEINFVLLNKIERIGRLILI